jgi:PST family polysaccharide transporter
MILKGYVYLQKNIDNMINLAALAAIQGGNALLPLFLFPYFLSVIGVEKFASIVTMEAVAFVILTFSLYSFDVSGLKLVIDSRGKGKVEESEVYYSILYARLIMFSGVSVLLIGFVVFLYPSFLELALIWLLFPLGGVLQSSYYYQALGRNKSLAVFVVVPRLLSCLLGVIFVDSASDKNFVTGFISVSYLVSGLLSFLFIAFNIGFCSPLKLFKRSVGLLIRGRALFVASVSVLLYRASNTLLLSMMSVGPLAISAYAIAEKYVRMIQALTFPLSQLYAVRTVVDLSCPSAELSIFPLLWKSVRVQLFVSSIVILLFFLVAGMLRFWGALPLSSEVMALIGVMIGSVLFGVANYIYGTMALSTLGKERVYAKIVAITGFVTVALSAILISFFAEIGAAVAYIFGEAFLFMLILLTLRRAA